MSKVNTYNNRHCYQVLVLSVALFLSTGILRANRIFVPSLAPKNEESTFLYSEIHFSDLLYQSDIEKLNIRDGPAVKLTAPPMGFMSWERFRCETNCTEFPNTCISEDLYKSIGDALVAGGFAAAGYSRVHIDDCWASMERNPTTMRLEADPKRFPRGMGYLANYLRKKGLKLGLYSDVGTHTCGGYPGSQGYENIDAETFCEWGADYIKLDGCYMDASDYPAYYTKWGEALRNHSPMIYSCSWPAYLGDDESTKPFQSMYHTAGCNTWRNWADIDNSWESLRGIVMHWATFSTTLREHLPSYAFHDADMLLIGDDHYGKILPLSQARLQMGFWALITSPLLIAADVRTIPQEHKNILLNQDIIAINQDRGGLMALCVKGCPEDPSTEKAAENQIWVKLLNSGQSIAIGYFNLNSDPSCKVNLGFNLYLPQGVQVKSYLDLWAPSRIPSPIFPRHDSSYKDRSYLSGWQIEERRDNDVLKVTIAYHDMAPTSHQMIRLDLSQGKVAPE